MGWTHLSAVAGALGLHVAVATLLWASTFGTVSDRSAATPATTVIRAVLLPPKDTWRSEPAAVPRNSARGTPARQAPGIKETPVPPSRGEATDVAYHADGALDRPARPVGEWVLDISLLPPSEVYLFRLTIWVSAQGNIERWKVDSDRLAENQAAAVFAQLGDTIMNPALLGNMPVASVQHLELSVERQ